ncbi:MAG: UDP-N-acetylmuramate dehydrogenase [Clostridia bacterium]|nr:UDP-N-acetylmuramate dehydrogenase [Clostridia bacterium]
MEKKRKEAFKEELQKILGKKELLYDVPMSRYTTLRVGGSAEMFCDADSAEMLAAVLVAADDHQAPVTLMGNGSNLLVRDGGLPGLVIRIAEGLSSLYPPVPLPDGRVALTAEAGVPLSRLAQEAADHGLRGLEFAAGIPGTVGGAICMNAGAYGGEMKDVVSKVVACGPCGESLVFGPADMGFGYRKSRFTKGMPVEAVFRCTVTLESGDKDAIRTAMREFALRRREKQPLAPSCGSTFKRPEGQFAGSLIEQCGLKGYRIGGVSVSERHGGFLVNDRNGTSADYLRLMAHVQQVVYQKTGVRLLPEVCILGEDAPVTDG